MYSINRLRRFLALFLSTAIFLTLPQISYGAEIIEVTDMMQEQGTEEVNGENTSASSEEIVPEEVSNLNGTVLQENLTGRTAPLSPAYDAETGTAYYNYVYFGSYPQSEVTGSALTGTIINAGYSADNDYTATVNGVRYRRLSKDMADIVPESSNDFKWVNGSDDKGYRYFRYEPVKWRVLENDGVHLLLLAENALDSKTFNDTDIYPVWNDSTIRAYLNEEFYNRAFTDAERSAVVISSVKDSSITDITTEDKVFLLSSSEAGMSRFGFPGLSFGSGTDSATRHCWSTEYAKAMGAQLYGTAGKTGDCCWWLRTHTRCYGDTHYRPMYITADGNSYYAYGTYIGYAVRPALRIPLASSLWRNAPKDSKQYKIYYGGSSDSYEIFDCSLEDIMDTTSSDEYNPQLAHMLIASCWSVQDSGSMKATLEELGFKDYTLDYTVDYMAGINLADNWLAYGMGKKKLADGTTLVFVTARGTRSAKEWVSNLCDAKANDKGRHSGFSDAADELYNRMVRFVGSEEDFDNTKFVITGFSRGAAAANIMAAKLDDRGVPKSQVYAYTFACPDTAVITEERANAYPNIFNIGNVSDTVTWVPGAVWTASGEKDGWGQDSYWDKYGISRWYCSDWNDYRNIKQKVKLDLSEHSEEKYLTYLRSEKELTAYRNRRAATRAIDEAERIRRDETIKNILTGIINSIRIFCPVNVEIYSSDGELAGRITNNIIMEETEDKVCFCIEGDKKYIYFLADDEYTIRLSATDDGEMEYSVQNINVNDEQIVEEKNFQHVTLTKGKQMASVVSIKSRECENTPDIRLFVLNEDDNAVKEIAQDGRETELCVTLDASGGTVTPETVFPGLDGKLHHLPVPVRDGYTFTGWHKDAAGTALWDADADTVTGRAALYAGWKRNYNRFIDDKKLQTLSDEEKETTGYVTAVISGRDEFTYTGEEIRPKVTVKYTYLEYDDTGKKSGKQKTRKLKENVDYTLIYENNIHAAEKDSEHAPTVVFHGIGDYSESIRRTFTIMKKSMAKVQTEPLPDFVYTGQDLKEDILNALVVKDGDRTVETGDYTVSFDGDTKGSGKTDTTLTLTIRASENGNYTGMAKKKITAVILSAAEGRVSLDSQGIDVSFQKDLAGKPPVYSGKAQKPKVVVKLDGKTLPKKNYSLIYRDNVNAGTAVVTVAGKNGYYGKKELTFTIKPKEFSKVKVKVLSKISFRSTLENIRLTVTDGRKTLQQGKDYSVSFDGVQDMSLLGLKYKKVSAVLTPLSENYKAGTEKKINCTIISRSLSNRLCTKITVKTDGTEPETVITYNGEELKKDTDYKILSCKKKNGKAVLKIQGIGNYSGKRTIKFTPV